MRGLCITGSTTSAWGRAKPFPNAGAGEGDLIQEMFTHSRVPKKTLEKFVGLCLWCGTFSHMKPALQPLCVNLLSFPPTHHGVPPALWTVLKTCLDESAPDPARRIHFRGEQADFGAACAYSHPFGS